MRKLSLFCFLLPLFSFAQTTRTPVTAVYTRINAYRSFNTDAFSFTSNQAALASLKNFSAGAYGEKRFLLADLGLYQLAFALPTTTGNFGLKADYFGGSSYNELQLGLAYGRSLGKIDVGAQFNYYMLRVAGYDKAPSINFEAGMMLHVTEQFQTGIHIYNPLGSFIGKSREEKLPTIYSAGFGYDASGKFFTGVEIQKEENKNVTVNAGLQYAFAEKIFARMGISSATSSFYLGAGFFWNGFRIDATASLHPYFGITPGIMLVYNSPIKK